MGKESSLTISRNDEEKSERKKIMVEFISITEEEWQKKIEAMPLSFDILYKQNK